METFVFQWLKCTEGWSTIFSPVFLMVEWTVVNKPMA